MRRLLLLPAAAILLGGCLDSGSEPPPRPAEPVEGALELERPRAGPPDAGTAAGHGARAAASATTRAGRFVLRGTVQPASSEVRLLDGATREQSAIARRRGAAFAFTVEHLRPGANRYVVEATHAGREPWRQAVRIVRSAPRVAVRRSVVVPRADASPAEAELRLDRRRLVAVAIGRDPGGMARIRVSAELRLRCRVAGGGTRDVDLLLALLRLGELRLDLLEETHDPLVRRGLRALTGHHHLPSVVGAASLRPTAKERMQVAFQEYWQPPPRATR